MAYLSALVTQSTPGLVKSAGQLLGTNTNDTAAAGFVGETIVDQVTGSSFTQSSPTVDTYYDVTGVSIDVTPGDWILEAYGYLHLIQSSSATAISAPELAIRTSADVLVIEESATITRGATITEVLSNVLITTRVNLTANTTYKLSISWDLLNGSPSVTSIALRYDATGVFPTFAYLRARRPR